MEITTGTNPLDPKSYDLKKAAATSTVTPSPFTLNTSIAIPVVSQQLRWKVNLIDGKTTLDLTADPRTTFTSSDSGVCSFGGQPGLIFSVGPGTCTITISQNTLSITVPGTVTNFTPGEVSTLVVPGALAIDVAGNFAYVAAGTNGLVVVDITDRTKPFIRGTAGGIGNAVGVRVLGPSILVADAAGNLRILQASNPDAPTLLSTLPMNGSPLSIAAHGSVAAVAAQGGGVSLVSLMDPTAPSLLSTFSVPGTAFGVDFDATTGLAAVAMSTAGLQLADISTPTSPRLRGRLSGGDVRRVLLRLPAALLADVQRSVTSVDVSNPDSPTLSSSISSSTAGIPVDIAAYGSLAITADNSFGRAIPVINLSDPLHPVQITYWVVLSPGFGSSVALDFSFGYVIIPDTGTLRIWKYQDIVDTFGIPPTVSIISPPPSTTLIQGQSITVAANATDDVAVASVNLLVDGQSLAALYSPPYQSSYQVFVVCQSVRFDSHVICPL